MSERSLSLRPSPAFLDDFTFAKLFSPITEEVFAAHNWERMPLIVNRSNRGYYGDLFTLQDFDETIARAPNYWMLDETNRNGNVKREIASGPGLKHVLTDLRGGATIHLNHVEQFEQKLGLLCRILGQQLGYRFQTNLYLTPPNGQGFRPHWDNHDVFILQVWGSKHWQVEKQRRRLPGKAETMGEDEGRVIAADAHSFNLNQGDAIYIPRGFVHAARCGSEPSLHITLGMHFTTWEDLLQSIIKVAAHEDAHLREALPLGFTQGGKDRLVAGVKSVLSELAEDDYLNLVVGRFQDAVAAKVPVDISGQIAAFLQPTPLTRDDIVGVRAGLVYRMHVVEPNIRLDFGGRTIVFPGNFKEALNFALHTKAYAVRDIAGYLQDEEKIVFVERLIQEGLVVRKLG
jgi:hypothetical protein